MEKTTTFKKLVTFVTEGVVEPTTYELEGPVDDLLGAFREAVEDAAKDGFRGFNYDLPERYLAARGLTLKALDVEYEPISLVGQDLTLVTPCACRDCSSYEEGSCYRYGGFVDGFSTSCDRLHGTGDGKSLSYGDEVFSGTIFRTDLDPAEAAKYVLESGEPALDDLKAEILEFFEEEGIDDPDENEWSFEEDMG